MADVLQRTTKEQLFSVNTPDYSTVTWIINPDLSGVAAVPKKYWKITGDVVSEMDTAEKLVVDNALLPGALDDKIALLNTETDSYIADTRYLNQKNTLDTLLEEAIDTLLVARRDYLLPYRNWKNTVYQYQKDKETEMNNAATLQVLEAVTWDFAPFNATDPQVTIPTALSLSGYSPAVNHLWVPPEEMASASPYGARFSSRVIGDTTFTYYSFVSNTIDRVIIKKSLKDWIPGQHIRVTCHWIAASGSGSVKWKICASVNPKSSFTAPQIVSSPFVTADTVIVSPQTANIEINKNPKQGDTILFQIERNGRADNFSNTAQLIGINIEYSLPQPNTL